MPYLQARFTNSWREHIDTFTTDVAGHPGCDILILEFNERSLDKLLANSGTVLKQAACLRKERRQAAFVM